MKRHNYSWAYWVQMMVVLGEYSHATVPEPDREYLRGLPDADKMTNFKEFVIRSDEKTRQQFENRLTHWLPLSSMLDNKVPLQKFYLGFLSQSYLYSKEGIDGCPDVLTFMQQVKNVHNTGINYPMHPNYVACLIPYTEEERAKGVVPEFAAPGSTMRYTSVQGYSESKKFYSPDYGNMKPENMDYRRTLQWVPEVRVENGEAVIEFYNSSYCNSIIVDVAGRDNDIMFSNDAVTRTRFAERKVEKKAIEKQSVAQKKVPMDSATLAACAYHHEKALIYYNQKRYKEAITMFAELVQYMYAPSIYYIGLCYRNGTGLTRNDQQAYKFFLSAAEHGEPKAHYELAVMLDNGTGTEKDEALAHEYYTSAAKLEEPRALVEMAHRYQSGTFVAQDKAMTETLLKKAAELNFPQALFEYGRLLLDDGRNGIGYIKAAAEAKLGEALLYMYEYEHKAGNDKKAYGYAKELHLLGDHRGTKFMADCYYEGRGVSRDKGLAKDLYREAANAGNEEAKKILQ
jgi:TPR repeat protein